MKTDDSSGNSLPEEQSANQIDIQAEGASHVNVVGSIHHADSVHVGNRYESPCTLLPPAVQHIVYTPDNRSLEFWVDRTQVQDTLTSTS